MPSRAAAVIVAPDRRPVADLVAGGDPRPAASGSPSVAAAALGLAATALLLNLPTRWSDLAEAAAWAVPLELVLAGGLLLLVPRRRAAALVAVLAALIAALALLRFADWGLWRIFGRPLTVVTDLALLPSLLEVARGSIGWTGLAAMAAAALPAVWLVHRVVALPLRWLAARDRRPGALTGLLALTLALAAAQTAARGLGHRTTLLSTHGIAQVATQVARAAEIRAAVERWAQEAGNDPLAGRPAAALFRGLERTDVILVFVESYGRSALETTPRAEALRARLADATASLAKLGIASASGWLVSPTVGGQSWLAHATVASGVWTDNQASHRAYLQAERADLAHLFARRGHETILVAPGWVHPFPEAARLGFGRILAADALGYGGPAFGFVNIPDQYTLAAFERLAARRTRHDLAPVYAQIALIGSHAPFTPLPPYIADWDALGDGTVLAALPAIGGDAEQIWRDREQIRDAYATAIDQTLNLLVGYAARHVDERTLLILLGDHEPAAVVTGDPDARLVPIHVLTANPALLRGPLGAGLTPGLVPDPNATPRRMDRLRAWLAGDPDPHGDAFRDDLAQLAR